MAKITLGDRTYSDPEEFPANAFLGSSPTVEKITKGTPPTNGPCKSMLVGTSGTLNYTDFYGNAHTDVPVTEGYNPLMAVSVQAGGTADDIWFMY